MPSEKLRQYVEADKLAKEAENKKKGLRVYIERLLKKCRAMGVEVSGVSYSSNERFEFVEDSMYEWVKTQVDEETLEGMTKKTIDLEKLQEAVLDGKIDTTKMPSECYKTSKYTTIRVNHK